MSTTQGTTDGINVSFSRSVSQTPSVPFPGFVSPTAIDVSFPMSVSQSSNHLFETVDLTSQQSAEIYAPRNAASLPIKTGKWSAEERELLLEWLGKRLSNYEMFKLQIKNTCQKISEEVFGRSRTAEGIRGQWEQMKRKYYRAKERLNSTGEGQREDIEVWKSIRLGWLDKMCPYYEQIDDIFRRDRAMTPLFVSESGGTHSVTYINGNRQVLAIDSDQDETVPVTQLPTSDIEEEALAPTVNSDTQPSVRLSSQQPERESPIRRGIGRNVGQKGLKRKRQTAEEVIEGISAKRMIFDESRFEYEKERDEKNFRLLLEREKNRHEETMIRFRLMEKQMDLQLMSLNSMEGDNQ